MNKKIATTLIMIVGILTFIVPARAINASSDIKCTEGPYGRICDTGLVISDIETAISANSALILAGVFGLGTVFTINGKILKAKIQK